ncbi:hypothetical protein [Palleronia sp.]|uniref:hypothetical protein n=1 Tax=Palleronia sp. TaxID=1940284 RepID=UPI0035C7EDC4
MYHDPKPIIAQPAWPDDLQRGDVVQFRFPLAEGESEGRRPPKKRPCLVLEIETKGSRRFITLAYGTDAQTRANQGYSIFVRRGGAMAAAGLTKPTHFVCARRITVAVDHGGFEASPATGSPIIGSLDETLLERMHALRARIHAEHDIAEEKRRERNEERRRWQREERGFRQRNRALRAATSPTKGKASA